MTEINFYYISEKTNLISFIELFLKKLYVSKKIIYFSKKKKHLLKLSEDLWTNTKTSFIPHILYNETNSDLTPILFSTEIENKYNSQILIVDSYIGEDNTNITNILIENPNFINSFEKVYFFINTKKKEEIEFSKTSWNLFKEKKYNLVFIKQNESGIYTKYNDFI